jgi:hypothetical protein
MASCTCILVCVSLCQSLISKVGRSSVQQVLGSQLYALFFFFMSLSFLRKSKISSSSSVKPSRAARSSFSLNFKRGGKKESSENWELFTLIPGTGPD